MIECCKKYSSITSTVKDTVSWNSSYVTAFITVREREGGGIESQNGKCDFVVQFATTFSRRKRQVCKYIPLSSRQFTDAEAANSHSKRNHASTLIISSNSNNVSFVWKPEFHCTSILQNSIWGKRNTIFALIYHAANIACNTAVEWEQLEKRKQFLPAEL